MDKFLVGGLIFVYATTMFVAAFLCPVVPYKLLFVMLGAMGTVGLAAVIKERL